MIIVTGSILAREDSLAELLSISLAHVRRSRAEAGCISHSVQQDAENSLRSVFIEEWADMNSLQAHFAVPASRDFVKAAKSLAAELPQMKVYDVQQLKI